MNTLVSRGGFLALRALVLALPLAVVVLVQPSHPVEAQVTNLVTNGSFESGTAPGGILNIPSPNSTTITGWTVSAGDIDYIGTHWDPADGDRSLDMNGGSAGTISQTIATVPGNLYLVRFALAGNPDLGAQTFTLRAAAASTVNEFTFSTTAGSSASNMGWQEKSFGFTADESTTILTFASVGSGHNAATGPALDNVRAGPGFVNGSFESGTDPGAVLNISAPNDTDITGWTVGAGDIDYIGTHWTAADGARSLDMNGFSAGTISQTIATVPGILHLVQFALAGNPDLGAQTFTLRAAAASTIADFPVSTTAGSSASNMGWQEKSFEFTPTDSSTTLTFASVGSGHHPATGPVLDNVRISIDETPPTVGAITPTSATVNQATIFSASYSDNWGVASCTLSAGGVDLGAMTLSNPGGTSGTASLTHTFTTGGDHAAQVDCVDVGDNPATGPLTVVNVIVPDSVAPTVGGVAPTTASVNEPTTFSASYADNVGVTSCNFFVDGVDQGSMALSNPGDTSGTATRSHTFTILGGGATAQVKCQDAASNEGAGAVTSISVADSTAPTVGAVSPGTLSVFQATTFSASYSDNVGVTSCTLFVDSVNEGPMTLSDPGGGHRHRYC